MKKYDLHTIDKCKDVLPIIIECFEGQSLQHFATLSDLPLIRLMNEYDGNEAAKLLPEIATYAHGIGPRESLIFYEEFLKTAIDLKLEIHPWTLQDDMLKHLTNPIEENILYIQKHVTGMFVEFPHMTKEVYSSYNAKLAA